MAITLSVLISCMLWFSFTMTEEYTVTVDMPVRVDNVPADEALLELPPPVVRVDLQGQGFQVFRIKYAPQQVRINAALDRVSLREAIAELPKNVYLQSVSPELIDLKKSPRVVRKVPVRLRAVILTPPTHDLIRDPMLTPDSILISGARPVVDRIAFWPTERVTIENLTDTLTLQVELADTLTGLVDRERRIVTLSAAAGEFTEDTRDIDVTVRGVPSSEQLVTLEPRTVTVRYRVQLSDYYKARRAPDFYAEVPYAELQTDTTGRVTPLLHLPEGLEIRDVEMIPSSLGYYWRIRE